MSLIENSKHLIIPFQDIKEATENFTTRIGRGGYGPVYRGQLSLSGELTIVAVKRLQTDNLSGQGVKEFLTEIQLLSRYKHSNLVSLVGFCEQLNEKFLVYEYAEHGSLDSYLKPTKTRCPLTWKQRINICVDAARGLDHLHNHVAQNYRIIHRDIKSANILLDHNWKAMIADFGLSKIGRANENDTYLITNASGTHGYCDPAYMHTGILTKESDIYSFGVVLFEVLCGRLCFINVNSKERFLAPLAQRYYKEKKLNLIIDRELKNYMNSDSMTVFSEIAAQCLQDNRKRRPSMGLVLQNLEKALELLEMEEAPELLELEEALEMKKLVETLQMQQFEEVCEMQELEEALGLHKLVESLQVLQFEEACEMQELEEALGLHELVETLQRHEFEEELKLHEAWKLQKLMEQLELQIGESRIDYEVIKAIYYLQDTPLSYITTEEIFSHLSHGILVDEGNVWFSIDDDGKTAEMISAIKCMPLDGPEYRTRSEHESRFPMVAEVLLPNHNMQLKIRTQFLSSDVTYAAYLVCKPDPPLRMEEYDDYSLCYKLNYSSESYISYRSKMEDHGWWMFELFQTINIKRTIDCNFTVRMLKSRVDPWSLLIEGIKFLPMQKLEDEDEIEKSEVNNLAISNIEPENHLPNDYKQFIYYSNKEMMKKPQGDVIFPTKEEAYSILSRGVLISISYEVNMWFWISKLNGKKCFMLPPTSLSYNKQLIKLKRISSKESRIENELHLLPSKVVGMRFEVPNGVFSPNTTYGCYLVYKTLQDLFVTNISVVKLKLDGGSVVPQSKLTYLSIPQSPVIGPHGPCGSPRPINKLKTVQLPRRRNDGWLEVNLGNKTHIEWMNMQQLERFDHSIKRKKSKWKSWFLPCISDDESGSVSNNRDTNNSFSLEPRCFSYITIYMRPLYSHPRTPELIVQGIEFRPV